MLRNLKPDADTYTTEYRVVRDDGSIVELEETGQALFDTAGKLQQLVGVTTDITARKQAEEALHNSEKMYRAIGESIDYGVWVCAPDGRNIYASDSFLKLVGLTQEQCSDFGWGEVLHPEDAERTISAWQECVRTGGNWDIEHRFRGVDGQWHPILARGVPVKNEDGIVLCWAGINLNIRRRKQAETELQKAHDELELRVRKRTEELVQTVDTLQTEIIEREQAERSLQRLNRLYDVLSETNQAIVRASERDSLFRDICRIAVDHGGFLLSWVGLVEETSGLVHISAAHGVTAYLEDIRILVNQEPAGSGPTGIALREGTHFICNDFQNDPCTGPWQERVQAHGIQASAAIALKQEGQVIGAFTVYAGEQDFFDQQHEGLLQQMGVDISFALDNFVKEAHHQEAEQALLQATTERLKTLEDLREKDHLLLQQGRLAAMGEMIGNIAHQWRQPLNTLGLTIQDLALSWELGEFCEELLQARVAKAMQVISHMSRTIDDFRNFFRPDKQKEPFKVSRIVGNALSLIGGSYKNLQIRVEVDTGTDPTITGYPNEFAQVLLNILSNARDALVATAAVEPAITIVLWETAGRTVVTIRDNAGGIPEEILDKIFDPYFSTKGPEQGTGLGLFMAKTIIETNMGGTLTVRNVGDGAEFRIEV
jgi:PAS domain S-box-containing protein